jgi:hypothetical protein
MYNFDFVVIKKTILYSFIEENNLNYILDPEVKDIGSLLNDG